MKIIQQRNDNDCMLAAIATVLGREYDDLWTPAFVERVIAEKGCNAGLSTEALAVAGLKENRDYWHIYTHQSNAWTKALLKGRRAIISVNSLNNQHGSHAVAWDGANLLDVSNKQAYRYLSSVVINTVWIFNEAAQAQAFVAWSALNATIDKTVTRLNGKASTPSAYYLSTYEDGRTAVCETASGRVLMWVDPDKAQ